MLLALALSSVANSAFAMPVPAAYQAAARTEGVPPAVLYALALTESGVPLAQGLRPWPWTLNVAGKSQYFRTQQAACSATLQAVHRHGRKRVDVGLTQINLGWHPERFPKPCAALLPHHNLRHAAQILRGHFVQSGDWLVAASRYHRPAGGVAAKQYQARFSRHLAKVLGVAEQRVPAVLAGY